MATETHIQDFLHSKKGEREDDDVVLSEIMEEKVTEFNGNKMKELEKSNEVVESVNTEKETEGGNFFQALSDPVVIAADDEDSTTPESCKAATTEDQEERGSTMIEGSKEELQDKSVESQEEQVEYEDEVKKHSDISNVEINEKPTTFLSKNEDQERKENVVTSSQDGTFEGNESEVVKTKEECIREDNEDTTLKKDIIKEELESLKIDPQEDKREQESTESVNKTVQTYSELKQEEGTEVLQPSIETEEKTEHLHTVTTDDCIKSEKESQVELKEEVKENEVYVSEKDEDFITSEDAKCEDIKESTVGQRGTTMASFAEEPEEKSIDAQEARELIVETTENEEKARVNDDGQTEKSESLLVKEVSEVKVSERAESELNENEIVSKEEIQEKEKSLKMSEEEEKTIDPQETSGNCEEIVTKIVQSSSEIEQEEDIEETKPSVEKGQQVCEEEEKYYDTETTMKEVSEETVSEKVEGLKFYDSLDITLNEKVEDEVKEQEVYAARDGGEDVTSSTPREILNDKSSDVQEASEQYESGVNEKIEQVPEEENVNENEEIKPSVETNEKEEVKIIGNEEDVIEKVQFEGVELSNKDDEQEHIILEEDQGKDDVTCLQDPISIQEDLPKTKYDGEGKEPEFVEPRGYIEEDTKEIKSSPEIKDDIKIGEKAIVDNDGQSLTNKSESPENAESELNVDEILSNEEIQEKKKEVKMLEDVDVYDDDIIISHNESSKDMKETNIDQHVTTMTSFEEGQNQEDKKEQKPEENTDSNIAKSCLEVEKEEDTEEIKPSVETDETKEHEEIPRHEKEVIETRENTEKDTEEVLYSVETKEMEENIKEEAIINDYQTNTSESPLVEDVCEVIGSENVVESEEGLKDFESSSRALNSDEIVMKEENQEKEQEPEEVKETMIGQHVTTVVDFEAGQDQSEMTKETLNEEAADKSSDVPEASGQYESEANEKIEQNPEEESIDKYENSEEIKPSVEPYETKEQLKTIDNEKDVSENVKLEGVEHSDKYENQERIISEEDEGKDDVTCLQDAISIQEDLPKTIYDGEGKEPEFVKPREFIEEDTKEIKPSVETEQQEVLHVVTTDKCITPQTDSQVGNEVKSGEPIQSGDDEKENVDNSTDSEKVEYGEEVKEVTSKIENEEKEQEVYMSGKDQGGEDVKEPIFGQHVTTVAYLEEEQVLSSISKEETVKIDEKNKESIESNDNDGQMEKTLIPLVNEVYEETSKEVCDETISKNIESKEGVKSLETFKDEDQEINKVESVNIIENIEEIKPSMETYELKEEKEITRRETDVIEARENIDEDIEEVIDSVETKEMEEKIEEETIVDDYGQTKTSEIPLVKEVCEVMGSEDVVESEEGRKDFESSNRALNQDEMVMKEENQEKDEEPEEVKETTTGQHVSTVVDVEERQDQSEITKEILNEEAEDKLSDADEDKNKQNHEESFNESLQPCSEIKQEEDIVDIVKIDNPIQIDDGQKENVNGSLVNEVRKETDSQKVEYSEEVKETVNENENGSKVEDEEKEQEVFMSEEGHALNSMPKEETTKTEEKNEECIEMDDGQMEKTLIPSVKEVYEETSSKNVEYEEGVKALQTFKDQDQDKDNVTNSQVVGLEEDEGKEFEVVKTREIMEEEDMEEIRSSVETTEDTDVITIDACRLTEKDTKEEAMENEEKIEEETIVNEDGQNGKFESPLVKEVCEVTSSEKVESVLNENKIVIKEENEEKEHELKMSEVVQGGVDDVTSSQGATCEDTKESTIGQHESALTKEVLMEEAKDKPIDAQEVNEEYDQNEEKDKTEESANIILHSGSEIEIPSVEIDENKQREVSEKDLQVNEHRFVEKGENMKEEDNEDVIKTHIDTEEKVEQEETTETTEEKNKESITAHVKEIEAFKDEDQVNMSTQGQSEDYVANSHVAGIEEDLQIKKYQEEEKEPELVEKNGESKEEEDTKEIKSSVETIETLENEEKIEEEEAIVNDDGQTEKSESLLVKEVSEVTISKKAESELNENEQKVKMSEEVKDCEDDDITSQNTSSEDIKETKDSSEISKDVILTKEIEQVPLETEKEKETNDLKEQIVEKDSHSIEDQKANVISEIDESPKQALESVCDVQTPEVILTSNEKELSDEVLLELDQPKEQTVDEITKKDENISHENDNYDAKTEEEKCFQDETIRESESVEEHNDGLNEASKEKSVELKETPAATYGDEEKETISKDFSIDENLGLQEGLKPASESVIEEDQVKETKHESERSDITYENIIKHTSEKDLADGKRDMEEDVTIAPEKTQMFNTENQNETIKNVILIDEVAVDTEKETENNVKDSPTELDNTSTSTINQKELSDEIEYSKAVPAVNNEVKAESPTEVENIQAPETTPKMEKKEEVREATNDTCETLTDGSLSEKKLESMVPPDQELTSSTIEDQTNEVGLETENTKVDHISISNKDQNLEFTNKEFPDTLVTEEKEDENKEKFEVFETLPENVTEASFTEKNEPKTTTNEKCTSEVDVKDVEKHEKAFDYTTGGVVVNDISKKEAGLESINQDNYQSELKKEADEKIEREIPTEKEPKEFDAYVTKDTTGIDELEISQKNKTDDQVKISQTHPEVQKYEPQSSSEVFTEEKKTSDEKTKGNSEVAEHLTEEREKCLKEETGEKGAKTEEENEEEEEDDDEDNQTNDAPVMVEASKDIEVKAHKKSHNILSGVGSKVKHSYAKVKKAITGKSSSPKASSPKEKDHMVT